MGWEDKNGPIFIETVMFYSHSLKLQLVPATLSHCGLHSL